MPAAQFMFRNRHSNTWYGQVVVPKAIRALLDGKRLIRRSLKTADKRVAKRRALEFWLECQNSFDQIQSGGCMAKKYIETIDALGRKHVIDLGSPKKEEKLARELHDNANKLIAKFGDNPDVLDRLLGINDNNLAQVSTPSSPVETPTSCNEAIDGYIKKLQTQGRKGKKLAERTLQGYIGRLVFWSDVFNARPVHELTLKELADIQLWLTNMPLNYQKKGITTDKAVMLAQSGAHKHAIISDKTRAEYLGQLKGFLEYAYASGFIQSDMAHHIEIPNTKQIKAIERLPFTDDDLAKIFNSKSYGKAFYKKRTAINGDVKFWLPLLAVFSGARLEELTQLNTDDIQTCPDTGIVYMNINDSGLAADGKRKQIKNSNSVRPIPVHSKLIKIGFLNYVSERKNKHTAKKSVALFDLKRDKQGRLGKGFSNWFSRFEKRAKGRVSLGYIETCGVDSKGVYETGERWTKTFHSFRHTVVDNLRGKNLANGEFIREGDIALVVGHEKGKKQTAEYGADRSQLELRQAVIEAIGYDDAVFENI